MTDNGVNCTRSVSDGPSCSSIAHAAGGEHDGVFVTVVVRLTIRSSLTLLRWNPAWGDLTPLRKRWHVKRVTYYNLTNGNNGLFAWNCAKGFPWLRG